VSGRRRIAVTSDLPGRALAILEDFAATDVWRGRALTSEEAVADFVGDADAAVTLLANPVGATVLDRCPDLRVVANVAVGHDNIDLEAARSRGVWVTNTPEVLTDATADLAMALILAVTRRIIEADGFVRAGRYTGWRLDLLLGTGLQGKTLGIVGYGRIGRAVARRARAFGTTVVASDPGFDGDDEVAAVPLEALLEVADVVSLHCPLNESTRGLMTAARFRAMKRGAYFVNTARGALHDERALVEVLEEGHLAGAALDVFEDEPAVAPGLVDREDVVLLPHVGSATRETRAAMAELAATNAVAVLKGRRPPAVVVSGRES
jgi:glyoxylate reductase